MTRNTDKLHFGAVKIVVDGSIQGFTARLRWPGYFNGHANGIWIGSPAELSASIAHFHAAGLQLHIHTNGDEATELALDAIEAALARHPRPDHRHTLQHCQMADAAQFRRMAALGVGANLFANHIYYWGDAHHDLTMGPDRACRMDACATALAEGVPLAIHSDAPITPLAPLFTAWCAVNRLTSSGRVLGEAERIGVDDALTRDHAGRRALAASGSLHRLDRGRQVRRLLRARRRPVDDATVRSERGRRASAPCSAGVCWRCPARRRELAAAADRHRRLPRRRQDHAAQPLAARRRRAPAGGAGQRLRRHQHRRRADRGQRRRHDRA